jgi:hypothetical protein
LENPEAGKDSGKTWKIRNLSGKSGTSGISDSRYQESHRLDIKLMLKYPSIRENEGE